MKPGRTNLDWEPMAGRKPLAEASARCHWLGLVPVVHQTQPYLIFGCMVGRWHCDCLSLPRAVFQMPLGDLFGVPVITCASGLCLENISNSRRPP